MAIQLRPVRPPIAIQKEYHKRLKTFIKEMDRSLFWWLRASYRQVDKDIIQTAQDGAMGDLVKELRRLEREWVKKSNTFAAETAKWFSAKIQGYTAITIQNEMKKRDLVKLGFNLKFKYHSVKERAIFKSIVTQNVNLIKSIASEHLTRVTGVVLRGIESGHDLGRMTESLKQSFGVTERRAAMISRDQTNKATQNLSRQRLMDYGVTKGKWQHSSAGKTYRESHVEMDGEIYNLEEGCYDPDYGDYIQPAELVNCHCFCIPVVDMGKGEEEEPTPEEEIPQEPAPEQKEESKQEETKEGFTPADSIAVANEFMSSRYGIATDYTGLDLEVANIANETFVSTFEEYPAVKTDVKFLGSMQNRNAIAKLEYEKLLEEEIPKQFGYAKGTPAYEDVKKYNIRSFSSRKENRIKSNTYAVCRNGCKSAIYKDTNGISINAKFGKSVKAFNKSLEKGVKTGFHPEGCDTIKSIIDHELGHQFDHILGISKNKDFIALFKSYTPAEIEKGLSGYAVDSDKMTTNIKEFLAEGWSEYRNNPKPRPIAREIGEFVENEYKKKFGGANK